MHDKDIIIDIDIITLAFSSMERAPSHVEFKRNSHHRHVSLVFPLAEESHNIKITIQNALNYFQLILFVPLS